MIEKTLIVSALASLFSVSVAVADDVVPKAQCETCQTPAPQPAPEPAPQPPPPQQPVYTPSPMMDEPVYDEPQKPGMYSYAWNDPTLTTGIGVSFQVGGGIGGFTDGDINDISNGDVGGVWQFRSTIGSHIPIGVDLAYNGTAYDLQTFNGATTSDSLIGTNLEGALRWNILPHYMINPYLFAGVGWQHYDLNDNTLADEGIDTTDDFAVFPMGVGVAYRDPSGLTAELRGVFRAAEDTTFIRDASGDSARMDTWEASAGIGYEL
jgi:hypothetical protein